MSLEQLPLHTENINRACTHYDEKHGIEIFAILPHSTEAQSHQLTHGRALNNSKHTSQLESTVRMYRGKKLVFRTTKEM